MKLKVAVAWIALTVGIAGMAGAFSHSHKQTQFERIASVVQRLNEAEKKLAGQHYVANDATALQWAAELFPYYFSEGIIDSPTYPSAITFRLFVDPGTLGVADQVLAYAECGPQDAKAIVFNARQDNPVSAWVNPNDFVLTLAHELAHIEGACGGVSELDESSAQEIALEVVSAVVDSGNSQALLSLVEELRSMGLGSLHYLAMKDHSLSDEYRAVLSKVYPDILKRADFDKRDRYWANYPKQRLEILYKYRYLPFTHILDSLASGELTGVEVSPGVTKTIKIDDLQYVFAHLEALATAASERNHNH